MEIFVEEVPSLELVEELGITRGGLLFGLYQGVPRPGKSFFQGQSLPDRILLFKQPILSVCRTEQDILKQIQKTLVHEIAHHFGLSEARIRHFGY